MQLACLTFTFAGVVHGHFAQQRQGHGVQGHRLIEFEITKVGVSGLACGQVHEPSLGAVFALVGGVIGIVVAKFLHISLGVRQHLLEEFPESRGQLLGAEILHQFGVENLSLVGSGGGRIPRIPAPLPRHEFRR